MTESQITQLPIQTLAQGETESQITQLPIQTLAQGETESQITQLPSQILLELNVDSRITQSGIYVLGIEVIPTLITQLAIQVLASSGPCLSYMAQCWRIERKDGIIHTFTNHDKPITYLGETYEPCGSIDPSAYQSSGQLGDVGNASLMGLISLDDTQAGIPAKDIATGALDAAEVKIWEMPWTGVETILPILKGYVGKITQQDINYQAEIITLSALLNNRSMLETYTPNCRFQLGDARCTVDLGPFTESSTVTDLVANNARIQAGKRQFFDFIRTEADGYWANGVLTWTGGDNAGYSSEVAASFEPNSIGDGSITLWNVMPNKIQVGDAYTIVAGCDKTRPTCIDKFNNIANFGGFPDVPGNDIVFQTPDSKQ